MASPTTADAPALSYSSAPGRWVLTITVLGSGIAALDATVVNIALPTIGRDFHTGIAALQWVMTSYIQRSSSSGSGSRSRSRRSPRPR
jgi:hypothetical protein